MTIHRSLATATILTIAWPLVAAAQAAASLTVADAVALGLDHHPQMGIAHADATAARSALGMARAEWLPALQVEATGTRFQEPMIVAPLHQFDPTAPPQFNRTLLQSQWTVGYTVFDGGGRSARVARETAVLQAQESHRDAARTEVIERVVTAYMDVVTTLEIDSAQHARVRALEAELTRANQLFDEGRAAQVDVLRARAAAARARADRVRTMAAYESARAELARQTGVPDSVMASATIGRVSEAGGPPAGRDEITRAAVANNPLVTRARHQLAAREAGVRVARATWFPDLRFRGGINTFGSADGGFTAEWQGSVAVSYPIFTGGRRSNAVGRANAEADAAAAAVRAAELEVAHNVDRAVAGLEEQVAQRQALEDVVVYLRDVVRIEQLALEVGTGVQTDYLQAESDLFDARAGLARARRGVIAARLALARLTGHLTPDWVTANLETEQ